jgi:hypothetical protein
MEIALVMLIGILVRLVIPVALLFVLGTLISRRYYTMP